MPKKSGKNDDDDVIMSNLNSNDDDEPTTQTPAAAVASTDGKTPVSSGGMVMRSGKKKKRNKSNNNQKKSAAFTATTPSRKRAANNKNNKNNNNKRSAEDDDATQTGGGGARKRRKTKSAAAAAAAVDEENDEDEGGSDDDVEMDDSHNNDGVVAATVTKVRFETTKEAVAAAQLAESDDEDEDDDEEEDDDDNNSDVDNEQEETEAAAEAPQVTGWRRLLTQHLRLPYQHTPAAVTAPSPGGPIPAGGRRLIFDTGVKNKENNRSVNNNDDCGASSSTTTTGAKSSRNKLLMQTRTNTTGGGDVATMASNQPSSRKVNGSSKKTPVQQQQQHQQFASPPTQTLLEELSNDEELKRNFKRYTLGWLALMLLFFLLGNVTNILGDYAWDVREQSNRWITKGNEVVQEENDIDVVDDGIEEVVVKVVDPNLLQQAKAILRAQRMNQHDIQMYENATAEIILALKMLESVEDQLLTTAPTSSKSSSSSSSALPSLKSGTTDPVAIIEYIESLIDTQEVVIFSKSYCPYCKATKALFAEMNIHPVVIELDELDNGSFIQEILSQMTGQETVPNVFVKKQHVGGNDDTQKLAETGQLHKLLSLSGSDDNLDKVKLDSFNSNIREKQELLEVWENVLVDVEAALESLDKGHGSIPNDVNAALRSLSEASMIPYSAMAVDTAQIRVPGEGCEGKDYIIPPSEINKENIVVDVVGGVDVEALDIASDAPLLPEDALSAYDNLIEFAQFTSEALIGPAGPSVTIQQWAQRLIKEECQKEGVDEPVSIQVESLTDGTKKDTSSSPAGAYNARAASKDIDRLLEIEDADRTGKFDYASVIHGARVLRRGPRATSLSLFEGLPLINRVLAYSKLRFYGHPPEVALRPTTTLYSPGHCWSFGDDFSSNRARLQTQDGLRGEYATLTVALSQEIIVSEVLIDHAPRGSASNNGNTAIKTFRVIGYEDIGAFGEPWELGSFQYDFKLGLQTFAIPTSIDGTTVPKLKAVSLAVDTNWGAEYSCLYRFRVHGG
jgi:glutaredoxin 3